LWDALGGLGIDALLANIMISFACHSWNAISKYTQGTAVTSNLFHSSQR
jgi:hypothetical protein